MKRIALIAALLVAASAAHAAPVDDLTPLRSTVHATTGARGATAYEMLWNKRGGKNATES
jgi:hypothetical protein